MVHNMRLEPGLFWAVTDGTKNYELRLNDEKRRLVRIDDTIRFINREDCKKSIWVKVTGLLTYGNFYELLVDMPKTWNASGHHHRDSLWPMLRRIYSAKQERGGVLGIKFEVCNEGVLC